MVANSYYGRQRGVVTIVTAVILLIVITILVLLTARVVLFELRVTSNEVRSAEAFENAMAGMSIVLSEYNDGNKAGLINLDNMPAWEVASVASVSFGTRVRVQGYSTDGTGARVVEQIIVGTAALGGPLMAPLTSRGTVSIGGNAKVINPEGNFTIWTGEEVNFSQNAAGQDGLTMVKHPTEAGTIKSSDKNYIGSDVLDKDTALSSLTDDEIFENFMGLSFDDYKSQLNPTIIDPAVSADVDSLDGMVGNIVIVDGDLELNGGDIGTEDQPVILIVDGSLDVKGSPIINGIVFVRGEMLHSAGTPEFNGSLIVSDDFSSVGNLTVTYNSEVNDNASKLGPAIYMPGAWRDW